MDESDSARTTIVAVLCATIFFLALTILEAVPEIPVDIDAKPFFIPVALAVLVPRGKPVFAVAVGAMGGEFMRDMLEGYEIDDALGAVGYLAAFTLAGYVAGDRPLSRVRLVVATLLAAVVHAVVEASSLLLFDSELVSIAVWSAVGNTIGDGVLLGVLPVLGLVPVLYGRIERYLGFEPRGTDRYGDRVAPVPRAHPAAERVTAVRAAGGPAADGPWAVTATGLTFHYPTSDVPALDAVDLRLAEGEVVGLAGPPGAGKTTLAMALAGLLPDVTGGRVSGEVRAEGGVGIVFDDPGGQLTQLRAISEVAEPLRTRGARPQEAEREARRLLEAVGLGGEDLTRRWVWELAEGQQVLLALAATLATRPRILVLDAVVGHLDGEHRERLMRVLREEAAGATVVLVEQDVALLAEATRRLVVLSAGRVVADGTLSDPLVDDRVRELADLAAPVELTAARELGLAGSPLTSQDFADLVRGHRPARDGDGSGSGDGNGNGNGRRGADGSGRGEPPWAHDAPRVRVRGLDFSYPDRSPALRGVDLEVRPGEVHAVVGRTGAGKSTLVRVLGGLLEPVAGSVAVDDQDVTSVHPADLALRVATVPQGADQALSRRRVRDEIAFSLRERGRTEAVAERVEAARRLVGLPEDVLDADPVLLPRAHRRLVALAAALVVEPSVVVLDAPFTGLGPGTAARVRAAVAELRARGAAVLITEHDVEALAEVVDTVTLLHHGAVVVQGPLREVLRSDRRELLTSRRLDLPRAGVLGEAVGVRACTVADLVDALSAPSTSSTVPAATAVPASTAPSREA
ncbi:ATP-binding cassette domain-containing protein [Paenibacillus sp. TRM 82003]|uniref:ABC transporter ATP-binding protein n=1 Tax=Kineococcus sp. TRM81007 TaxID=2925831 RepID=UPI001F58964D|nr:ATP-binding cassette domain-containing protein [Kineococcus sp. TRM81007]MCI2236912.1 ATP-binding cassette domain-containing protein [Kineococcus sp. TRM81007]MCI3921904.1 ATP-binding cassette domain-containing protein [Paenibacillus sp. TRM 82003]